MAISDEQAKSILDSVLNIDPIQQAKSTATGALQGVFLEWADETGAYLKSSFEKGEMSESAYKESLKELRDFDVQQMQENPVAYFTGKIVGSAIAANVPARYIAPFATSLRTLFPALVGEGAVIGGLTGAGSAEEGESRIERAKSGAIQGAILNPVFYTGINYAKKPVGYLFNQAKEIFRRNVQDLPDGQLAIVIRDMAERAKVTPDDIVEAVINGRIPAETNRATSEIAMLVGKQGEGPSQIISGAAERRIAEGREKVKETLTEDLFPTSGGTNILEEMQERKDFAQERISKLYDDAYKEGELINEKGPTLLLEELQDVFKRFPEQARSLKKAILADQGVSPFFKFKKVKNEQTGETEEIAEWAMIPTIEQVEIVRRSLKDLAAPVMEGGSKSSIIRGAAIEKEKALRNIMDDTFPELKLARQEAADQIRTYGPSSRQEVRGAYEQGKKALTKDPEQVEIEFEKIVERGLPDEISAYRAGIMSKLKFTLNTPRVGSTINNLADETSNAGSILRIVYPEDKFDEILRILENTRASQFLGKKQFEQSITGDVTGERGKQIGVSDAYNMTEAVMGNPFAQAQLVVKFLNKNFQGRLSPENMERYAKFLVEEDPEKVRRIFNSIPDEEDLADRIMTTIRRNATLSGAATELLATPEGKLEAMEQAPKIPSEIKKLAETVKKETIPKILNVSPPRL
tara:strand:- start:47 stop:2122 length:2076 start_codon:yes stop_codon:yes gene_type:complete